MTLFGFPGRRPPGSRKPAGPGRRQQGRRWARPALIACTSLTACLSLFAQPAAPDAPKQTNPSTTPAADARATTAPAEPTVAETPPSPAVETEMRKAFAGLADGDPDVRDAARATLMGLERRYLPALRTLVAQSRPLAPAQAAVLRPIVTQIYLGGEPYEQLANAGFLGVRMMSCAVRIEMPPEPNPNRVVLPGVDPADFTGPLPQLGVIIAERIPGFVGHRLLLEGDVILGIVERPELVFTGGPEFTDAVRETAPGRPVHFVVLRRGRVVKLKVPLDARPAAAADPLNAAAMEALDRERRAKAQAYWLQAFAPLVNEEVG